MSSFRCAI